MEWNTKCIDQNNTLINLLSWWVNFFFTFLTCFNGGEEGGITKGKSEIFSYKIS